MFRGRFEHTIDPKGRLALPSAWKKDLRAIDADEGDSLIITTHLQSPCLVAYPLDEWQEFEERIAKLPQFDPNVMTLRRLYVGGATECAIDKQYRVLIPPVLREYARLEREVYWVGGMRMMEIWAKDLWQEQVEPVRAKVDRAVLEKLAELGV